MACVLTRQEDGVFEGQIGKKVTIQLVSAKPAKLVHLSYAGEHDGDAPFTFVIKAGEQKLLIVAVGTAAAGTTQRIDIVEAGTPPCPLRLFFWSTTHFSTELDIRGI